MMSKGWIRFLSALLCTALLSGGFCVTAPRAFAQETVPVETPTQNDSGEVAEPPGSGNRAAVHRTGNSGADRGGDRGRPDAD